MFFGANDLIILNHSLGTQETISANSSRIVPPFTKSQQQTAAVAVQPQQAQQRAQAQQFHVNAPIEGRALGSSPMSGAGMPSAAAVAGESANGAAAVSANDALLASSVAHLPTGHGYTLRKDDVCDVIDTELKWRCAEVWNATNSMLHIHYTYWATKWDEVSAAASAERDAAEGGLRQNLIIFVSLSLIACVSAL